MPLQRSGPPPEEQTPEAQLLEGWERSAGLRVAPAPVEGPLVPNGTGYLVALGPASQRLYPRATRWARWSPLATVPGIMLLPFLLVPSPYGPLGVGVLAAVGCWLPGAGLRAVGQARLQRHLARAPLVANWRQVEPGQVVRLRGTVMEQSTAPGLFSGRPAVLARSEWAGVSETRGMDFRVELTDGEVVWVAARDVALLGAAEHVPGNPACGPLALRMDDGQPRLASALLSVQGWFGRLLRFPAHELTLAPGDEVELCGTIHREPAPDGESALGRAPPLRTVLRPAGRIPALVRKREGADDASS